MTNIYSFYVYAYLRYDGTIYYIGKGAGRRALEKNHTIPVPPEKWRIIILENNLSEVGAYAIERRLIRWYGRKNIDLNGTLRNQAEGGTGGSMKGVRAWHEAIQNRDTSGKKNPMYGRSAVREKNLKWYNNGIDTIYVTEGTQPDSYIPGRIIKYRRPASEETKKKLSQSKRGKPTNRGRKVISPDGTQYNKIAEAAAANGMTASQFRWRLVKTGDWVIK